ncbi:XrtA/PEP-CTERM system TPR-repeat protein PrsT [Glaciecola sp. 1036]|uniref:XrtA/PEP-CTERM system TPR-repeat protein PrsT n=1 Tax=Alteromonadaceae TaxID=72275 RepID=UPI003D08CB08
MQSEQNLATSRTIISKFIKGLSLSACCLFMWACAEKSAEEHIEQANVFLQQGDNKSAIVELKNAVQQNPSLPVARFELGKIYLDIKDFESAEKELSRALELGYSASKVIPLLSEAYQRTGANVALSELDLETSELTSAEKLEVGYRKLQSLLQLEKNEEAQSLIEELLALNSDTVYKGLVAAISKVIERDFVGALETAESMRERAPLNRDVLNFTARMHIINNQQEEAAKVYEDYIRVAPDDVEIKFALANMLVEQGQMEKAEKYIDELMEINNQNGLLNQLKGVVRAAAGDHEQALTFSETAIQNGRVEPTVRLVAGYSAFQLGRYEKAVQHLSYIAEFLPDNHPGLRILAASQLQSNMGDQTQEVLARVDPKVGTDASLFSRAGYELLKAGDEEGAKKIIEQAEKISETADDLTRLGILKLSLNDIEGMINLEDAVNKAPESVTAKTTLATAYLATNQLDKAMALAKEWQSTAPADVEGYLLQAEVEQRQENYQAAAQTLENAASLDDANDNVLAAKVRLLLRQNKIDDALAATEELLAKTPAHLVGLASYFAINAQKGEVEKGKQKLFEQLKANPDNKVIKLLAARASLITNKVDEALEVLSTIEADKEAPAQYWPLKGTALLRSNAVNEAEAHYNTWSKLYPNQEAAVLGYILVLDSKSEYQKALDKANEFLAKENNLQVNFARTYLLIMTNQFAEAKTAYEKIDNKYKELPFLRGIQARLLLIDNKPSEAVPHAVAAYESNKGIKNLLVLIQAYELAGQPDESYELIKQHAVEFPNDVRNLMLLAERQIDKDQEEAIATYNKILEVTPNNFVVLNNLAYLEMEKGDLAKAEVLAKQALDIQADNVAIADTYAQILVKQSRIEDALEVYKRVITDNTRNEEILLNYIEALLQNGDLVIAERRLERSSFTAAESKARIDSLRQTYNL